MTDKIRSIANRRTFLKTSAGIASVGFLAGCLGEEDPDPDDPADPDDPDETDEEEPAEEPEEDFPTEDILHLIPFGPGGGYDEYSRLITPVVSEILGVNVRVQNVEGAGGQIATEQVWNAEPDGYTEFIVNMVNFSLTQLTEDVEYDLREFTHYAQIAAEDRGIAVGTHTGIETFDEYVEAVQNEELRFASTGPGSGYVTVPGVTGEVSGLYPAENVMNHQVIYDGRGEAVQGLLAGDVDVMSGSYWSILPYTTQAGGDSSTMIIANTWEEEPPEPTPDIDTLLTAEVENGELIQDMLTTRRLISSTPGLSDDRAAIMRDAYEEAITDDDFQAQAEEADRPVVYADHEECQEAVENFIGEWEEREDLLATLYEE